MISNPAELVASIIAGDETAIEQLYRICTRGNIAHYLYRRLGSDAEDVAADVFVDSFKAIQRGQMRQPALLLMFLRSIARHSVAEYIENAVARRKRDKPVDETDLASVPDHCPDPERALLKKEQTAQIVQSLDKLSGKHRNVLVRFYVTEQTKEQIMAEMGLSYTQFRLLKTRALGRFAEAGERVFGVTSAVAGRLRAARNSRNTVERGKRTATAAA